MSAIDCFWIEPFGNGHLGEGWIRPDTQEVKAHPHDFGVGAIYDARWLREREDSQWMGVPLKKYADGLSICVITPDGVWVIDGPSYDGKQHHPCPWTRTGDPSKPETFSVTPSINFPGRYHGWLTNGRLIAC